MTNLQFNRIFQFLLCSVAGPLVFGAPWQDADSVSGCGDGRGPTPQFDSGRNFMGFGCGGNGGSNSNPPFPSYHHISNGNLLKNLPPGSNTTLIPLGQVLIPTGKEVCCCTNRNQNGNGMFGNSNGGGYGSNMGSGMTSGMTSGMLPNMGNYGGCCQTSGDDYGSSMYGSQYGTGGGQPYGNGYMSNNGFMSGNQGSNSGYGFGGGSQMGQMSGGSQMGQMSGGYQTGDYSNGCGSPMDGCCPCCTKKRRRRFVDQLFRSLKSKRRQYSKSKGARIY